MANQTQTAFWEAREVFMSPSSGRASKGQDRVLAGMMVTQFPWEKLPAEVAEYWVGHRQELPDVLLGALVNGAKNVSIPDVSEKKPRHQLGIVPPLISTGHYFVLEDWQIEEHRSAGAMEWNPSKVRLHFSRKQQHGDIINGHELRPEITKLRVLNAAVLDFLYQNPQFIPEDWKGKFVHFWGTIYRSPDQRLYVRYLYWIGGGWHWGYSCLNLDWDDTMPAAVGFLSVPPPVPER